MRSANWTMLTVVTAVLALCPPVLALDPYELAWVHQVGTPGYDQANDIAVTAAGVSYVVGDTTGNLGALNEGGYDVFLSKFTDTGAVSWTYQDGTPFDESCGGVATDGGSIGIFMSGCTYGDFAGANEGDTDAFLARVDQSGNPVWKRQFGTSETDNARCVTHKGSEVYFSGGSYGSLYAPNHGGCDALAGNYDYLGNPDWGSQIGGGLSDYFTDVRRTPAGNLVVAGFTYNSLFDTLQGTRDAIVACYSSSGAFLWGCQDGTAGTDDAKAIGVDSAGNIYVAGNTDWGDAGFDTFLLKYNSAGTFLWSRMIGHPVDNDYCSNLTVDDDGHVFVCGYTYGNLYGPNEGALDGFVVEYSGSGAVLWNCQFGTEDQDRATGVGTDEWGDLYVAGYTYGDLGCANLGNIDIFLAKYEIPEPATLCLLALGGLALVRRRRSA